MPPLNRKPATGKELAQKISSERDLRRALVHVLRRLGMIGETTPSDARLVSVALAFGTATVRLADDRGDVHEPFSACLAKPNPKVDNQIPF